MVLSMSLYELRFLRCSVIVGLFLFLVSLVPCLFVIIQELFQLLLDIILSF
jgi:hypothetical protein